VVIPNGAIVKTGQRSRKSSAGYDLTHLFIGSEGTLGLVTKITVRLQRIPEQRLVATCEFPSIEDAANCVISTMQRGIQIGKVELLDEVAMKSVNLSSDLNYPEKPTLFFEFSGSKVQVEEQRNLVANITADYHGGSLRFATDPKECEDLWFARKTALWSAPILRPGSEVKITDVCVPISRLAECIRETKEDLHRSPLLAPLVGHVGDGNFHLFILFNPNDPKELEEESRLDKQLTERAIRMEGTCTGEHGIGMGKKQYLLLEKGEEAVKLMKTIKKAIDPDNIMNPGKVLPD